VSEIRVQKLGEQLVRVLGRRLINASPSQDLKLPSEQDVCKEFSVSRTVAREAMGTLESLDLIKVSQGRSATRRPEAEWDYLNPLILELHSNPKKVRRILADLHQVRLLLEPEIAARAAQLPPAEFLDRLSSTVTAMKASLHDPDCYLKHDLAFHMELARACDNLVLSRIVFSTRGLLTASRRVTNLIPGGLPIAQAGHEKIYRSVVRADPSAARLAMTEHLEFASKAWTGGDIPFGVTTTASGGGAPKAVTDGGASRNGP